MVEVEVTLLPITPVIGKDPTQVVVVLVLVVVQATVIHLLQTCHT